MQSTADMLVADATMTGTWIEDVFSYAAGYQFRLFNASGDPNDEGDVTINPCPVVGDRNCSAEDRFGPMRSPTCIGRMMNLRRCIASLPRLR